MQKKINIAFLMQNGLDINRNSGPQVHFKSVINKFVKFGHKCQLLSLQPSRVVVEYNVETEKFNNKPLGLSGKKWFVLIEGGLRKIQTLFRLPFFGVFDAFRFREACKMYLAESDIFYERYSVMGFGGIWAAKNLNKPLILEVHADIVNYETPLHGKKLGRFQHFVAEQITKHCFRQASVIVVVSNAVKDRLQTYWKVPPEKIRVVPLGVDVDLFEKKAKKIKLVDQVTDKTPSPKTVFFMGSFLSWHGVDILVDSFRIVLGRYPNLKLKLVGDGLIKNLMEDKVAQLGLEDKVEFTGDVPHETIPDLLQEADICVAPYKKLSSEMWFSPLKVFEYMFMEKPIVASNSGQIAEILQHGYSGYLVEPGNPDALAKGILELLLDPQKAKMLGKNAREKVLDGYTWDTHCKRLERIMQQIS